MKALLDTHAFLWAVAEPEKLSKRAARVIEDEANQLLLSVASLWEIVLKAQAGKLQLPEGPQFLAEHMAQLGIGSLPVDTGHVLALLSLPLHHRDPFDRLLVAQCQTERLPIVTADKEIRRYDVQTIW
jgi:PIN domain nuclease of toxin-antitoxin system